MRFFGKKSIKKIVKRKPESKEEWIKYLEDNYSDSLKWYGEDNGAFLHYRWLKDEDKIRRANDFCSKYAWHLGNEKIDLDMQGSGVLFRSSLLSNCVTDLSNFEIKNSVKAKYNKNMKKYSQKDAFNRLKVYCDFFVCANFLNDLLAADELQLWDRDGHNFSLPISLYESKTGSFHTNHNVSQAMVVIADNYNIELDDSRTNWIEIKHKRYGVYEGVIPGED